MDWRAYFTFSKRERIGILSLMAIMIGLAILPAFWKKPPQRIQVNMPPAPKPEYSPYSTGRYADSNRRTENRGYYRNDYGARYERRPYNQSRSRKPQYDHEYSAGPRPYSTSPPYHGKPPPHIIEINTADTTAFIGLPGIGSKLAARIILFRDKLGGFCNVDQLAEVYGIQDSTFQVIKRYLTCDASALHKLNINDVDREILRQHPYIRWNLANTLVAYRDAHGPFHSPEDLEKVNNIEPALLKKLLPYLSF